MSESNLYLLKRQILSWIHPSPFYSFTTSPPAIINMKSQKNIHSPFTNFPNQHPKALSPSQQNYLTKLNRLQLTKQILSQLKSSNHLSTSIQKLLNKKKKKKKKKKVQALAETMYPRSYTSCHCLDQLRTLAQGQSSSVRELLRDKEILNQSKEKLKFYANVKESRQAYFIEEIQRRNLEIIYMKQKLEEKSNRNQHEFNEIQQKIQKFTPTKSKTTPKPLKKK